MSVKFGIGIDIGSTASKAAVVDASGNLVQTLICPTGFSSVEAADNLHVLLDKAGYSIDAKDNVCVATGYGRVSVSYADRVVTEITCHGCGAYALFKQDGSVIDVGGQDTKVIKLQGGKVKNFLMNDKCSAGTGRFLEIMADRLGVSQEELSRLASGGIPTTITNTCTVFAESEVISLVGKGEPRENIARGVIDSVVTRVAVLVHRLEADRYFLTGGLCENAYVLHRLSDTLSAFVTTCPEARFAGAYGAALFALDG